MAVDNSAGAVSRSPPEAHPLAPQVPCRPTTSRRRACERSCPELLALAPQGADRKMADTRFGQTTADDVASGDDRDVEPRPPVAKGV
jgi:hypothetical protein